MLKSGIRDKTPADKTPFNEFNMDDKTPFIGGQNPLHVLIGVDKTP